MFKGRVEKEQKNGRTVKVISKLQRKNGAKQLRQQKMADTLEARKLFDGSSGAQKIVTVVPLTTDVDVEDVIKRLIAPDYLLEDDLMSWNIPMPSIMNLQIKKFRSKLKVIVPDMSNLINILDSTKVADFVVFALSGTSEVDPEFGEQIIRAVELQGIASCFGVVANLSQAHPKEKFQLDLKQSLVSYFKHFFPNEENIFNLEKPSEALNALRTLCQKFPRQVKWRDNRGYLVAESVDFIDGGEEEGVLAVEGTVRGVGLEANRLVHVPGLGDFQVAQIERISSSGRKTQKKTDSDDLDLDLNNVFYPDQNQDSLEEFAPQELEMADAYDENDDFKYDDLTAARYDDHGFLPGREQPQRNVNIPKGTSDYQARWYLDDVVEGSEEEADNEMQNLKGAHMQIDGEFSMDVDAVSSPQIEDDAQTDGPDDMFVDLSAEEEERQLKEYRAQEKDDLEFPDEIELEPSESAIEALKRYRGLKNLHNCVWDVDEYDPTAPPEWKRLLRIGNYKNTKNKVSKEAIRGAEVVAGDLVKVYIKFPRALLEKIVDPKQMVFAIYGLLKHEHKNALVNFSIQRWEEYEDPVPSEEPLVVQYGIRRYVINPLYSSTSHTPNNVHKFDKFLHQNSLSIATCIAPVDFTQSPALFFKQSNAKSSGLEFVGHGTFLNADHTRIISQRIILTGHPFRFHKRVVTVRYMFFRPDDVEWFKSIPLFTKSGRTGFIKESLGTHGYFKASFDGKLSAQDVVAMSLYKRVWPRPSFLYNMMEV